MKNQYYFLLLLGVTLVFSGFNKAENENLEASVAYEVPENINAILEESCIRCHSSESKNKKAKFKLKLDQMSDLKLSKQISKLSKIAKEVGKGDMPPKKYLEHNPDKALSAEDKQSLIDWAKSYSKELAN